MLEKNIGGGLLQQEEIQAWLVEASLQKETSSRKMDKSLAEISSVIMVMNPGRVCKAREWSGLKIGIPGCLMLDPVEYGNGGRCELIKEPLQLYGEKELGKARHLGVIRRTLLISQGGI